MKALFALPLLAVAACAGKTPPPEPIVRTVEVVVPGPAQPCVPKTFNSTPPVYVDTDEALVGAKDGAERYRLLYAGRLQRIGRLGEVETIVRSCPKEK
jgi:hypothetical protein